jgi:hypothetical protein
VCMGCRSHQLVCMGCRSRRQRRECKVCTGRLWPGHRDCMALVAARTGCRETLVAERTGCRETLVAERTGCRETLVAAARMGCRARGLVSRGCLARALPLAGMRRASRGRHRARGHRRGPMLGWVSRAGGWG